MANDGARRAPLHSTIALAAPPTGIASLGAPIALKKEPEAVVVPDVVARDVWITNSQHNRPPILSYTTASVVALHMSGYGPKPTSDGDYRMSAYEVIADVTLACFYEYTP